MARLSSPGSGEGLPLQLEPPATVACSDSALSGVVATGPTWLSSQIGIMQLGNWILLLLTFSYFNLNSHGGYLDSSALQTLLSHQAGQGPSRCVPFILHLYSSRPLAAPTSRKSLFLHMPLCGLPCPTHLPPYSLPVPRGVLEGRGWGWPLGSE